MISDTNESNPYNIRIKEIQDIIFKTECYYTTIRDSWLTLFNEINTIKREEPKRRKGSKSSISTREELSPPSYQGLAYASFTKIYSSISGLSSSLTKFAENMYANTIKVMPDSDTLQQEREHFEIILAEAINISTKIKSVYQMVSQMSKKYGNQLHLSEIEKLPPKEQKKKMDARQRIETQVKTFSNTIIKELPSQKFEGAILSLEKLCDARVEQVQQLLSDAQSHYAVLQSDIQKIATELKEISDDVHYKESFSTFVNNNNIIRYDIPCPPFVPIDISGPEFEGIPPPEIPPMQTNYPIALGYIEESFVGTDENTLSCTRGQYILLMEPNNEEWVFCMSPVTFETGYIPNWAIKVVGIKLGVITREAMLGELPDDVRTKPGDYIAILRFFEEPKENPMVEVMTTFGKQVTVPNNMIGIISNEIIV